MSVLIDTSELISGAVVIGNTGHGVSGLTIRNTTASGVHGAGYIYNDVDDGDADKEFRGLIVTPPSAGSFFAYEDGSFTFTGSGDGSYSFVYQLSVDGVDLGTATSYITVGSGGTNAVATCAVDSVDLSAATGLALAGVSAFASGGVRGVYLYAPTHPIDAPLKPIRKTRYVPAGNVPTDIGALRAYLQLEFERISDALESPFTHDSFEMLNVEPGKMVTGKAWVAYADGVNWDPTSEGEGLYVKYGGTWRKLG